MFNEDLIWSQNSSDKTDISRELMQVLRQMTKDSPLNKKLAVLSIGSGFEPQLKILIAAFQSGVTLLDIDDVPLNKINTYAKQRGITNIRTVKADYTKEFLTPSETITFRKNNLNEKKQELITLHHSLYYSEEENWLHFWIDDFEKFMAVIWMILLYPNVHNYTDEQKEEITEFVYKNFWTAKKPLLQMQDYLTITRNMGE